MTLRVPPGSAMLRFCEHCYFSRNSSKQPKKSPRWLSKPVRFRNKSSLPTPPTTTTTPHSAPFNNPAGLACCPWAGELLKGGGGLDWNPGLQLAIPELLPSLPPSLTPGEERKGLRELIDPPPGPFQGASAILILSPGGSWALSFRKYSGYPFTLLDDLGQVPVPL